MTDPQRKKRGRPKGSIKKSASGKAKQQQQQQQQQKKKIQPLSSSVQAHESLIGFDDKAATPRKSALAATAALLFSANKPAANPTSASAPGKRKGAKATADPAADSTGPKSGRPRSILSSPAKSRGGGSGGGSSRSNSSKSKRRKTETGTAAAVTAYSGSSEAGVDSGSDDEKAVGPAKKMTAARKLKHRASSKAGGCLGATDAAAADKKGHGNGRPAAAAAAAAAALGGGGSGRLEEEEEADEEGEEREVPAAAVKRNHSRSYRKVPAAVMDREDTPRKRGSRTQPRHSSTGGRRLTVDTGVSVASAYPKRKRNAPDVFKAEPSSKPISPAKLTTPARGGSGNPGETSLSTKKPIRHKKGAAPAAAATAAAADAAAAAKSPLAKKKTKKPATPSPPPPPPPPPPLPPYRFKFEGRPAVGGRELLAAGMFLHAAAPMFKFGRGFQVNMKALEDALSSDRPEESDLLTLVHSRLLCTRRELKSLKPGELKYPFSWWTERLHKRLADWYRRRAVLRELLFETERSDDERDGACAGEALEKQQWQVWEAKDCQGPADAEGVVGPEAAGMGEEGSKADAAIASDEPIQPQQQEQQQQVVVCAGEAGGEAAGGNEPRGGRNDGGGEAETAGAPNWAKPDAIGNAGDDCKEAAAIDAALAGWTQQESSGGGVETTGEDRPTRRKAAAVVAPLRVVGIEQEAALSKRVSPTQCAVCNTRGTVSDSVKCIYEGCGKKFHLRCLLPVVDTVPKGQWYCPDCRAKKRVYGCNGCMQNDRPSKILQCDGPKCGLEYHYGCLDPPLDKVPNTKWWYCPDCVRTDNKVGCRVCKKDVDYDKLLKCDGPGCELEWHMYCLQPPIKFVPKGDFFCPYCKAKQKVEFEKKRQQGIARANARRRLREARMARAGAAAGSDSDDGGPDYERRGGAAMRRAFLKQYQDLDPDSLRLELHRITILLRHIEEAREASDALAAAAAAAAGAASAAVAGDPDAGEGAGTSSPASKAKPKAGESPSAAADTDSAARSMLPTVKAGDISTGDGNGSRFPPAAGVGADQDEEGVAPAASAAGSGAGGEGSPADARSGAETKAAGAVLGPDTGPAAAAAVDVDVDSGGGGNGGTSRQSGGGGSGGGEDVLPKMTDPVAAFWAELAAAAPAESVPTDGSGDGDACDEEGEEEVVEDEEEVDGPWGGAGDSPLTKEKTYGSLSATVRVGILSALCEEYMDDEDFRLRVIDVTDPDLLRADPFGHDSAGRLYFRFAHLRKEMRVYRTVEADSPIPPVDKLAAEITGGGFLEAAAEAAADREAPRMRGGSELELVADSLEGMERLAAALGKSKSKNKKEDDARLHASLAEEVEEMKMWVAERKEKEEKKRLLDEAREKRQLALEAQPRRRSGRLVRAEAGWAAAKSTEAVEEEGEDEEGEDEEEDEGPKEEIEEDEPAGDEQAEQTVEFSPEAPANDALGGGSGNGVPAPMVLVNGSLFPTPMDTGEEDDASGVVQGKVTGGGDVDGVIGSGDGSGGRTGSGSDADGAQPLPESEAEEGVAQKAVGQLVGEDDERDAEKIPPFLAKRPRSEESSSREGGAPETAVAMAMAPEAAAANLDSSSRGENGGARAYDGDSGGHSSKRWRGEEGAIADPPVSLPTVSANGGTGKSSSPTGVSNGGRREERWAEASTAGHTTADAAGTGDVAATTAATVVVTEGHKTDGKRVSGSSGGSGGTKSAVERPSENGYVSPAVATVAPVGTPHRDEITSNGALSIMALAASSRPKVSTPSCSRSPSEDRSGSRGGGGGGGGAV